MTTTSITTKAHLGAQTRATPLRKQLERAMRAVSIQAIIIATAACFGSAAHAASTVVAKPVTSVVSRGVDRGRGPHSVSTTPTSTTPTPVPAPPTPPGRGPTSGPNPPPPVAHHPCEYPGTCPLPPHGPPLPPPPPPVGFVPKPPPVVFSPPPPVVFTPPPVFTPGPPTTTRVSPVFPAPHRPVFTHEPAPRLDHRPGRDFSPTPLALAPAVDEGQCSALAGEIASILNLRLQKDGFSNPDSLAIATAAAPLIAALRLQGGNFNDPGFQQALTNALQPLGVKPVSFIQLLQEEGEIQKLTDPTLEPQSALDTEVDPTNDGPIACSSAPSSTPTSNPGLPVPTPGLPGATLPAIPGLDTPATPVPAPVNGLPAPVLPVAPVPAPAAVDDGADPCLAPAVQEYTLVGRCSTLDAEGGDHTPTCNPSVRLVRIPTGGLAVCFAASDSTRVVFIGTQPSTVDPRTNGTLQSLDRVRFRIPTGDAGEKAANGTCALGNLNQGVPATIVCRANTDAGGFDGTFVTNGSAPKLAQQ